MQSSSPLRIVHLTVYRDLPSGVRKQIKWEQSASKRLNDVEWTSIAVHGGEPLEPFEKRIPRLLRPMFLRNLYGWLIAFKLARKNDILLFRHIPFDPFALLFALLIPNRVSVHHAREWEELPLIRPGLGGLIAGAVERLTGWVSVRFAKGLIGVTSEIARFQAESRAPGKPTGLYANGIDLGAVDVVDDQRSDKGVQAVFISNTFSEWHGLDRLVDAVRDAPMIPDGLVIHLIGNLSEVQVLQIKALRSRAEVFQVHGFLETEAYRPLLAEVDIGLGSFAMDRQNLKEGATLKVREMLGMGLPVYSGHVDTALNAKFPFFHHVTSVDIHGLEGFARRMRRYSRCEVRAAAAPFIEKAATMQAAAEWLRILCKDESAL